MFVQRLLGDRNFNNILKASRQESQLNKKLCKETNLTWSLEKLTAQGLVDCGLRLQGDLLLGIVRIYCKSVDIFIDHWTEVLKKVQKALKPKLQSTPEVSDQRQNNDMTMADFDNFFGELPEGFIYGHTESEDALLEESDGPLILDSSGQHVRANRQQEEQRDLNWAVLDELPTQEELREAEQELNVLRRSFGMEEVDIDNLDEGGVYRTEDAEPAQNLHEGLENSLNEPQSEQGVKDGDAEIVEQPELIENNDMEVDDIQMHQDQMEDAGEQQIMDVDMGVEDILPEGPQISVEEMEHQNEVQDEHVEQEQEQNQEPDQDQDQQQEDQAVNQVVEEQQQEQQDEEIIDVPAGEVGQQRILSNTRTVYAFTLVRQARV
eukprot:TRINITY_DN16317_c0_g2_i2.p2 TRINITY_DN16317_c0_g2~~TRINITY_DN16317_c0_g2_i2.p2  ORF type:complete len:378 (-),score=78.44 TRINITY_DN16317_c0_g2_i2:2945-4078(-)